MFGIKSQNLIYSKTDLKGIITEVSDSFCNISGYSREELLGQPHNIVRCSKISKEFFKDLWDTIKSGKSWNGEVQNRRKDGTIYCVDAIVEPIFDENGNIIGYQSFRFDITDRKNMAKELIVQKKKKEHYKKIFNQINIGIGILDNQGMFTETNDYFCSLLGYEKDEINGKKCDNFTHKDDYDNSVLQRMKVIIGETSKATTKKRCVKKDGSIIHVESVLHKLSDGELLIALRDIQSEHQLEMLTHNMIEHSKNAAMGEMLSMIAHQWRQPLTSVVTILSRIKLMNDMGEYDMNDYDADYEAMSTMVQHLSQTIDFFRNFFKDKAGVYVAIDDLFKDIQTIISPIAAKFHVKMDVECRILGSINVDTRIDQVLLAIYKNAFDAFSDDLKDRKVTTRFKMDSQNKLIIEIEDNAGGIPVDVIDNIFEPYFSTKSHNGTVLGLYISKMIIEDKLNGQINVENRNNGAVFTIVINNKEKN